MKIVVSALNKCTELGCEIKQCEYRSINVELVCTPQSLRKLADEIEGKKKSPGYHTTYPYGHMIVNDVDIPKIKVQPILSIKVPSCIEK